MAINPTPPATSAYMQGRKTYSRPQAILLSNNPGTPTGTGAGIVYVPTGTEFQDFIVLTDDNRSEINISQNRIENRIRTINGTMRSYWTADKLNISTSWSMVPSRSFSSDIQFDDNGKPVLVDPDTQLVVGEKYTTDAGAAGDLMLQWYQDHPGPFWVYLSYDKYINFTTNGEIDNDSFSHLSIYNQIVQVYFASFDYNVVKRGSNNYDFWNVSFSLEEV